MPSSSQPALPDLSCPLMKLNRRLMQGLVLEESTGSTFWADNRPEVSAPYFWDTLRSIIHHKNSTKFKAWKEEEAAFPLVSSSQKAQLGEFMPGSGQCWERSEDWNIEVLVHWNISTLNYWNKGIWTIRIQGYWYISMLEYYNIEWWNIGILVCCNIGILRMLE